MFDNLAQKLLRKDFWQGLIAGQSAEGDGSKRFTAEELRNLYDILHRNPVVHEGNRAMVVETVRSIAEFLIWGDQHEPRIFEFFMENNIMVYLHKILQQPANRSGEVAKQVLQTLGIIIQNVRSETGIYFLFSNNHINNIVGVPFDFEDEEVLGFYISFLKAISLKLTPQTVQFFIVDEDAPLPAQPGSSDGQELAELEREGANQQQGDQLEQEDTALHYGLPLYSEAIKFAHHHEGMVRAGVRTLTLNVLSVQDAHIQAFVTRQPAAAYFTSVANYLVQQVQILEKCMSAAQSYGQQQLSQLDSEIAEVEDMLSYCNDVFMNGHPYVAHLLSAALWQHLIGPCLLSPLVSSVADGTGQGKQQGPGMPGVQAAAALYVLERCFALISYTPLVNNLAIALLALPGPAVSHGALAAPLTSLPLCSLSHEPASSDTVPFTGLLHLLNMAQPHTTAMALRCLVALAKSPAVSPEVMAAFSLRHTSSKDGGSQEQHLTALPETGPGHCSVCRLLVHVHEDCKDCRTHSHRAVVTQAGTQQERLPIIYYTAWSIATPPRSPQLPAQAVPDGVQEGRDTSEQLAAPPGDVGHQAAQKSEASSSFSSAVTGVTPPGASEDAPAADPLSALMLQPADEKAMPVQQAAGPPPQVEQLPVEYKTPPSPPAQQASPADALLLLDDHDTTPQAPVTTPQPTQAAAAHDLLGEVDGSPVDSAARAVTDSVYQPPELDLLSFEHSVQPEQKHAPELAAPSAADPLLARPPPLVDLLPAEEQPPAQQEQAVSEPPAPTPASQPESPAHPQLESQLELLWRDPPPAEGEQGRGQPVAEAQESEEPVSAAHAGPVQADFSPQGMAVNGLPHAQAAVDQHPAQNGLCNKAVSSGVGCLLHYQQLLHPDSTAAQLLRALVSVLQGSLVPVQALWLATHLLMAWFVRPAELQSATASSSGQQAVGQQQPGGDSETLADPLQASTGGAAAGVVRDAVPLDESTKADLMASLTAAAGAALEGLQEMWAEAFFPVLGLEWSVACEAIRTPVLRTSAHLLMMGPHLYPQPGSGHTSMGTSAVAALRLVHLVQRLVAVLQMGAVVRSGGVQQSPPLAFTQDLERRAHEVIEGQQVEMTQDKAIACQVSFALGQEKRVYYTVAGAALAALDMLQRGVPGTPGFTSHTPAVSRVADPAALRAELLHSSPAIVLAEPAPTRLHAGVVLSSAPLMGAQLYADPGNPRWLHIHVRPSVRGLLKVWRQAQSRKGGLPNQLRSLADGHWVLQFQDGDRVVAAIAMAQHELTRLQSAYKEHAGAAINTFINTLLG